MCSTILLELGQGQLIVDFYERHTREALDAGDFEVGDDIYGACDFDLSKDVGMGPESSNELDLNIMIDL